MASAQELLSSVEATHALGIKFGSRLKAGDLILLSGPMGVGKTALTQGIGKALAISEITSPTFVISRIYPGKIRMVHVDAYRLQDLSDSSSALFDDLDLGRYLDSSITVVEWGEGLVERFASEFMEIKISFGIEENERLIEFNPHGARWQGFEI